MRGREFHIVLAIVPGTWTDTTVLDAYKPVADAFVAIEDGDAIALSTGQRDPADIISLDDIAKVSTALAKDALQEAMELAFWRGIRENAERSRGMRQPASIWATTPLTSKS